MDKKEVEKLIKREPNISGDIIINPRKEVTKKRKTKKNAQLIVLAYDIKQLRKAVVNVRKNWNAKHTPFSKIL